MRRSLLAIRSLAKTMHLFKYDTMHGQKIGNHRLNYNPTTPPKKLRRRCIKIMAAEHTFKLLLAETKKGNGNGSKRPRSDDQVAPEVAGTKPPKSRKGTKANKSKMPSA